MEGEIVEILRPRSCSWANTKPETNYDRTDKFAHAPVTEVARSTESPTTDVPEKEKSGLPKDVDSSSEIEAGQVYPRKSYWQKLGIVDKKRPNRMLDIFFAPFKGFTYPVIVYAGLMYGANALVWSGVQNATTGTVYTTRYGFSTSGVAAAYSAGIIGAIIGYVTAHHGNSIHR